MIQLNIVESLCLFTITVVKQAAHSPLFHPLSEFTKKNPTHKCMYMCMYLCMYGGGGAYGVYMDIWFMWLHVSISLICEKLLEKWDYCCFDATACSSFQSWDLRITAASI